MYSNSPRDKMFTLLNCWGGNISPVKNGITVVVCHLYGKVTCGINNPPKKLITTEGRYQQETSIQQDIIGEATSLF